MCNELNSHERRVFLNHIRRLQNQNTELAEAVADERLLRKAAWKTYWDKINTRCFGVIGDFVAIQVGYEKTKRKFEKETTRNAG